MILPGVTTAKYLLRQCTSAAIIYQTAFYYKQWNFQPLTLWEPLIWSFFKSFDGLEFVRGETLQQSPAVSKKTDTKWNTSTFCGTVPQFVEQRPKIVEQLPKKWNRSCKRVKVQQIVEQKAKLNILNL